MNDLMAIIFSPTVRNSNLILLTQANRKILTQTIRLVKPYSYRSSNYYYSNSCGSVTLLKALAKSNGNLIAIAFKSDNYRYRDSWKNDSFRKEAIKKEVKN